MEISCFATPSLSCTCIGEEEELFLLRDCRRDMSSHLKTYGLTKCSEDICDEVDLLLCRGSELNNFCVTARRDTIVMTRLSRLILLAAIGSPIGRQFPYVNIDWSFFCVLEAISRPISNRCNRVASGTSGRPDVEFWTVHPLVAIWSESWRMCQSTLPPWMY